jgi:hypothetical protein
MALLEEDARCYKVNGGFTLLGSDSLSSVVPVSLEYTRLIMTERYLDGIYPGLIAVRFLHDYQGSSNKGPEGNSGNDDAPPVVAATGELQSGKVWPWAVIGSAMFTAFALLLFRKYKRRTIRSEQLGDDPPEDDEEEPDHQMTARWQVMEEEEEDHQIMEEDVESHAQESVLSTTIRDPIIMTAASRSSKLSRQASKQSRQAIGDDGFIVHTEVIAHTDAASSNKLSRQTSSKQSRQTTIDDDSFVVHTDVIAHTDVSSRSRSSKHSRQTSQRTRQSHDEDSFTPQWEADSRSSKHSRQTSQHSQQQQHQQQQQQQLVNDNDDSFIVHKFSRKPSKHTRQTNDDDSFHSRRRHFT